MYRVALLPPGAPARPTSVSRPHPSFVKAPELIFSLAAGSVQMSSWPVLTPTAGLLPVVFTCSALTAQPPQHGLLLFEVEAPEARELGPIHCHLWQETRDWQMASS